MKEQPRSRVVTFRLSEAEYAQLRTACGRDRQSISDVARRTVLEWTHSTALQPQLEQRLSEMADKLDQLMALLSQQHGDDAEVL